MDMLRKNGSCMSSWSQSWRRKRRKERFVEKEGFRPKPAVKE